ncbi:hypothetical protein [Hymenobacter lapidiphilus]|uniref:RHS repeat-associated core domain-containing protein n=1 Tax=Hymenobacter lapidiphilus TaxID=2608003 RepID=A0A7Y7U825_9BACT|nr:hypothetical protein [Hymenobacter lapidiphilus]NVO33135.1 hypothetical protein [Hymenobacter lapidiphilus]
MSICASSLNDTYRQYYSPYVGMGNNPVNSVDPDGGKDWFRNKSGALEYDANVLNQADVNSRHGGGEYAGKTASGSLANGSYVYGLADGSTWTYLTPVNVVGEKYNSAKAMMNFSNDYSMGILILSGGLVSGGATAIEGAVALRIATSLATKGTTSALGQIVGASGDWRQLDVADVVLDSFIKSPVKNGLADCLIDYKPFSLTGNPISSPLFGNKPRLASGVEAVTYAGVGKIADLGVGRIGAARVLMQASAKLAGSSVGNFGANQINQRIPQGK